MKKLLFFFAAAMLFFSVFFSSCMQDENIILDGSQPFSNMQDSTTTSLEVTIPRIEWSTSKNSPYINVYVSVTDQDGNVLHEFNDHNFKLSYLCKGEPDTIEVIHKSTPVDEKRTHIAAAATMDYSGSMSGQDIDNMETAIIEFIRRKHHKDYMQIIKFASAVQVMNEVFSADTTVLINAVNEYAAIGGMTAYFDAIYKGLLNTEEFIAHQRTLMPAILAFTDGRENYSNHFPGHKLDELIDLAAKKQMPVYTIGFGNVDEHVMNRIASETGGRYFYTPDSDAVDELYELVAGQLEDIYGLSWEYYHIECDELTVIVEVTYENQNGVHEATAVRDFLP